MDHYHLTNRDGEWRLAKEKAQRATRTFDTKAEAMEFSTGFMRTRGGSLTVHKQDGTIQEERTYPRSADPRRSPG